MEATPEQILNGIKTFQTDLSGKLTDVKEFADRLSKRMDQQEALYLKPDGGGNGTATKSIGEQIAGSDEYRTFVARHCKGSMIFVIPDRTFFEQKTAITDTALGYSTPGVVSTDRGAGIITGPRRKLRIRDLMAALPTVAGEVEYVRESGFTSGASPQVEASEKGESDLSFDVASARIATVATWVPISRQAAMDVPGLMDHVNTTLLYAVKREEEIQFLTGSGTGSHMLGIIPQATAFNTGLSIPGDTDLDTLRRAILQVDETERGEADGIVLNPRDAAAIDLIKTEDGGTNTGRYIVGDPLGGVMTIKTLWGKPVIESMSMPAGRFLVGAFRAGGEIRDRMGALVEISESHSDYFVKNMLAVRAECRSVILVKVPAAFVYGVF